MKSGRIPAVTKTEHSRIRGHDVQHQTIRTPPGNVAVVGVVFPKAVGTEARSELMILSEGHDFDDRIHVLCGTKSGSCLIRDQ